MSFVLASTLHDPQARIFQKASGILAPLLGLYSSAVITATETTDSEMKKILKETGFQVIPSPCEGEIGTSRKFALETVVEQSDTDSIHYCDFDRLIHWFLNYPEELQTILRLSLNTPFTTLGRTKRAWSTHPRSMYEIEKPANEAIASALNLSGEVDFTAGSCLMTKAAAETIVSYSIERTNATDLEWPALIARYLNETPKCLLTEGLEFETADYFEPEIKQAGSRESWLASVYDNSRELKARQKLTADSINAFDLQKTQAGLETA